MRAFLVSSVGVACAAVLAAPTALPAATAADLSPRRGAPPWAAPRPVDEAAGTVNSVQPVPGSTRTVPLAPLSGERAAPAPGAAVGLEPREVEPFSLLGVTWEDASTELPGTVRVRTRAASDGEWSKWQNVQTHTDDAPEPGSGEGDRALRGSTAPLWVGPSDAVQVRVEPEQDGKRAPLPPWPDDLRLDLVDPGLDQWWSDQSGPYAQDDPAQGYGPPEFDGPDPYPFPVPTTDNPRPLPRPLPDTPQTETPQPEVPQPQIPQPEVPQPEIPPATDPTPPVPPVTEAPAPRYTAPRPKIINRKGWGADERLRERAFRYTGKVRIAFVHHSATGNNYTCAQAPSIIRGIYRYHVLSSGWRDIGYNFLIDKCGRIYEGRAGGVAKSVMGAHTYGWNRNSTGISLLGTYTKTRPPAAAVRSLEKLTAWKLGLSGVDPRATVTLTSGGGKYKAGTKVRLRTVAGHRDGFATDCPGAQLYRKLPSVRLAAAKLQRR